jgi:hypothetical protein
VSATFPDEDISRLHVEVDARLTRATGASGASSTNGASHEGAPSLARALDPAAAKVVSDAVTSLFELLRGMGGESSAAAIGVEVSCILAPPR